MYIYTVFLNSVYIYMYMYVFAALTSHRTPSVWLNELPPWEAMEQLADPALEAMRSLVRGLSEHQRQLLRQALDEASSRTDAQTSSEPSVVPDRGCPYVCMECRQRPCTRSSSVHRHCRCTDCWKARRRGR